MNNTFLLFYSPKPRNQVRILINRKWSSGFVNHGEQKRLESERRVKLKFLILLNRLHVVSSQRVNYLLIYFGLVHVDILPH